MLAAVVVLLLAAAIGFGRTPPSDNSVQTLAGGGGDAARAYRAFAQRFEADDLTVVELEAQDPDTLLAALLEVHETLRAVDPGLVLTASTTYSAELTLLTDDDLGGPQAWSEIRPRLANSPLNQALGLLDPDGHQARAFALSSAEAPPTGFASALRSLEGRWRSRGVSVRLAGSAVLNDALEARSERIARTGLPLVALTCVIVLWVALRRLGLVLLILMPVGLVVLAVDRVHGGLGGTTNLLSVASRPVSLALLLASTIHLILAWIDLRFTGRPSSDAAWEALREKWPAITLALMTTAVGFGSLTLSDVGPIREFGVLTASGLCLGLPVVLVVVPTLLDHFGERVVPGDRRRSRLACLGLALVRVGGRRPWIVIGVAGLLTAAGFAGVPGLSTQTHAIEFFGPDAELARDHRAIESHGLGLQSLEILVDGVGANREDLERLEAMGRSLEQDPQVLNRIDLPTLFREANHRVSGSDRLPNPLLMEELRSDPPPFMKAFLDERGARTTLLLETRSSDSLRAFVDEVRREAGERFGPERVEVSGSHRLILESQARLLRTMRDSLVVTALVMQLVVLLVLGPTGIGWMAVLPNALPVALTFGTMRAFDIPLDLGTSMVAALALGIAVDDTLHFGFACRRQSIADAACATGRGIILSSITIAAGFSTLIWSGFAPTIRFGMLTSLAMLWATLGDLVVFPALMTRLRGRSEPDELNPSRPFVPSSSARTSPS